MQRAPEVPGLTDLVQIGHGGNGVVYRAMQTQLRRVVAVKVLSARLDDESAERFAREGQALGVVSGHPNIVPVYSADTMADGTPYFVMLLCDGGSLYDRLVHNGRMEYAEVIDLGVRMCGALQTAHDAGMLHRDIKPGNILFDSYGVPRLADFGQARIADTNLTRTGEIVATPGYAAPEVLSGERATVRSDVYSLATTLLAALLGSGPFARDTDESVAAVLLRVLQEPPPDVRQIGVPAPVADVLEHAMDKTPGRRPMSAGELGRQLQRVQAQMGLPQTPMTIAGVPLSAQTQTSLVVPTHAPVETTPASGPTRPLSPEGGAGSTQVMAPQGQGAAPTFGAPMPAASAMPPAAAASRTRSRTPWLIGAIAAVVVAGVAVWAIAGLGSSVTPTNPDSASSFLIGSDNYGSGDWSVEGDEPLVNEVVGSLPETNDGSSSVSETNLSQCLGLDLEISLLESKTSALYTDTAETVAGEDDDTFVSYRIAQSVALTVGDDATAASIVGTYASPGFETCIDDASGVGVNMGQESESYTVAPKTSVPTYTPDVPEGVTYQARVIELGLETDADGNESDDDNGSAPVATRYVTVIAMAAGTAVEFVVVQSSAASQPVELYDGVLAQFIALTTD